MPLLRRSCLFVGLLLLAGRAQPSHAQNGAGGARCDADPARGVCAVDDSIGSALIRRDTTALARFYGDDLLSINYRGVRSTKPALLNAIAAGRLRFDTLTVVHREVDIRGDTAVVTERMHQRAVGAEGPHPVDVNYHRTYRRRLDRWQLTAAVITSESPAPYVGFGFDVAAGSATGNGGNFLGRDLTNFRVAAGMRRVGTNHLGLFGEIGLEFLSNTEDYVSLCVPDAQGGCTPRYPSLVGPSALVGVIAQPGNVLEMRAGIGGAAYSASRGGQGTVVGAGLADVDVSVFPVTHLGILFGIRGIVVPRYHGDRLTMAPWSIGVRVR